MTSSPRSRTLTLIGTASAAVLTLTACGGGIVDTSAQAGSDGATVHLEFASYMAENHPYSQWYLAWAEEVTEKTDGRITFDNYWSSTVLESAELAPGAGDGRVDLAHTSTSYNPDMFPLSEILSVPFATEQIGGAIEATVSLYEEGGEYQEEFADDNLVPLHFQPAGTNVLGTSEPVDDMADLAGASVRSGSYYTDAIASAGANPISMPLGDVYQSMQTGLVGAWMTPIENATQFNLAEVTPYIQDTGMGSFGLVVIAMNADTFEELSDEDQQVLVETSADYNARFVEELLVPMDAEACEAVVELGSEPRAWTDEAVEEARTDLAAPLLEAFVADANSTGASGGEFATRWQEFQDSYSGDYGEYPGSIGPCVAANS
jgi:TRAP-type C4-dicarboxylate transport system substrate-binding protein